MVSQESKRAVQTRGIGDREPFPVYKNKEKGDNNND